MQSALINPRIALRATVMILGVALACIAPATASATSYIEANGGTAPLLRCSNPAACPAALANLGNHQSIRMKCYLDDVSFTGRYSSPRWFLVVNGTSQYGWTHSSYVEKQSRVGLCTSSISYRKYVVANWALQRAGIGETYAEPKDRSTLALFGGDWQASNDGPPGEWAGDCYRFVFAMWKEAGNTNLRLMGTAYDVGSRLHLKTDGTPPIGALVFYANAYNGGTDFGHVAISMGDGTVVGTRGFDGQGGPISGPTLYNPLGSLVYRGYYKPL